MNLKVSPSLLDQYRSVCNGEYNKSTEDLVEYIVGEFKPNIHTSRGNAYHMMLEYGPEQYIKGQSVKVQNNQALMYPDEGYPEMKQEVFTHYEVYEKELGKTWMFSPEAVKPIYETREELAGGSHEVWDTFWMESNGHQIRIRLKYDMLLGLEAHEFKTTGRAKKWDDYRKTVQWKLYLMSNPELQAINYRVFQLNQKNTTCKMTKFRFAR